ncbi:TetR/AcrR family transcriptional regulator [Streptomyces sp. H10-C2]|uniref:TetR/AcrR family transcriptional regulator n=1 Tax=unclassified Streptomyces TaxID=2593676 RepID=UPI0024BBE456|nr:MULTISPECIES: TetR/AcrR family transcriptional regulator [unclassified Streptomyces]MDJ0341437.1 TetR/AcrR family transcriptional regulator [Streptomyces sp. PH10-H1]MDJ0369094.1 TetR/AcrR family transcriptional regulator [Streptomyces sp. H10-C2]
MTDSERPDGRRVRGQRMREAVLDTAVALASVDGLDGLSLARLSGALGVSKSGLFTHWRDKEQLQLDVVDRARKQWGALVVRPALDAPAGVRRLFALHEARLAFYADDVLPGGCFFAAVQPEFDDRPGAVRDRVAQSIAEWMRYIESLVDEAVACGDLRADVNAAQLAFEIDALGEAVVTHSRLMDRAAVFTHAHRAVLERLRACCTDPSILRES